MRSKIKNSRELRDLAKKASQKKDLSKCEKHYIPSHKMWVYINKKKGQTIESFLEKLERRRL